MKFEDALKFIQETRNKNYVVMINGKKHNLRLFTNGDLIGEYGKGMRHRGYGVSISCVMEWESIDIPVKDKKTNGEKLRKTMTTAVKYLRASGLWENLRTSMDYLLSLSDVELDKVYDLAVHSYDGYRKYCEKNNIHLSSDELFGLSRGAIKSINYHSWERDEVRERFAKAIAEKTDYRHRWEKGYDNSIECKLCNDGTMCAWYSEEYRGCGNGHYYLALDERHAMFCEND